MRDFSISVDIQATPERVWQVLSDGERWHEWTPSVTSVELLDKSIAVGSRAIIKQPELPAAKFKVTALDPGKRLRLDDRDSGNHLGERATHGRTGAARRAGHAVGALNRGRV